MIKIFNSEQVKLIDNYTINNEPVSSIELMERAAKRCTAWLIKNFERNCTFKIICGPGNNGGDGLAIARQLVTLDYDVEVFVLNISNKFSVDCAENLSRLKKQELTKIKNIEAKEDFPQINKTDIVVDAIFGSGLNRPVSGLVLELIQYLNNSNAHKIAIDIPSGLVSEGISEPNLAFNAHHTLTFESPFLSFFLPENEGIVGAWHILEICLHKKIISELITPFNLTEINNIKLKERPRFGHKGTFGHVLIIAGSEGMAGAAVLSAKASLHAGCGMVTIHTCKSNARIVQTAFPEAMVSYDESEKNITKLPNLSKYSAIAAGPGMGQSLQTIKVIYELIENAQQPLLLDADALNFLSQNKELHNKLKNDTILTPHPGEFDRLFGKSADSYQRLLLQQEMAQKLGVIIVLKGRYTCIALPNGESYLNSTGNNGIATAGSGDTLTGVIVSLLAQGYQPKDAAITGVFLHGLAGDIALAEESEESLTASDITKCLGKAFKEIRKYQNWKIQTTSNLHLQR